MINKLLFWCLFMAFAKSTNAMQLSSVEPAFWWVGMKNVELQLQVYGKNIGLSSLIIDYPGVEVKEVAKTSNPNYLFLYLTITPVARPGVLKLQFISGQQRLTYDFPLLKREVAARGQGFGPEDALYLITPDRFANGNRMNDELDKVQVNRENPNSRHGGDLAGISSRLDYISDMGFTTIWLNPVQENNMPGGSYHGYSITDFYKIDRRFGTNNEYRELIQKAHSKGLKVVMDMIFNHCGISHPWLSDLPDKDWIHNGEGGKYVQTNHFKWALMDVHAPQTEKDQLVNGWFSKGMPDLNQKNRHLATYLIQNSIWWIEFARIDGIRQDTYPYPDMDFMARWCSAIEQEYPNFNIVGESWYPQSSAAAWWQQNSVINKQDTNLKTVMDFALTFAAQHAFDVESNSNEGDEAGLFKLYEVLAQDFLYPDPSHLLVFLDNHDMARFSREGETDLSRYKQAIAFLLTIRGIPQIYYGTEILMDGKKKQGDGYIRKDFPGGWQEDAINAFDSAGRTPLQNEAFSYLRKLLRWRKNSIAVTTGDFIHYTPDSTGVYVYARKKDDHTVLVMINSTYTDKTLAVDRFKEILKDYSTGTDVLTGLNIGLKKPITIKSRGVYILELK